MAAAVTGTGMVFGLLILAIVPTELAAQTAGVELAQYQVLTQSSDDAAAPTDEPAGQDDAPLAPQFTWIVSKTPEEVVVDGFVPNETEGALLLLALGADVRVATETSQNAPEGFSRDAGAALDAIAFIETGSVGIAEQGWFLEGILAPDATLDDVAGAIQFSERMGTQWSVTLDEPPVGEMDTPAEDPIAEMIEEAEDVPVGDASEPLSVDPAYTISVVKSANGSLAVTGQVPDGGTRTMLVNVAGSLDAVQGVELSAGAPNDFTKALFGGIAALDHLDTGRAEYSEGAWTLTGSTWIDTQRQTAIDTLERLALQEPYKVSISAPSALSVCRDRIAEDMDGRTLLFASGSAVMTPDSRALLPALAEDLNLCPDAEVYVEGHTDSDGSDAANLSLSIARAESVVYALVELGVAPERLYAVGYGASLPIASNETSAGKLQNRRIVFSFEDTATPIEPGDQ